MVSPRERYGYGSIDNLYFHASFKQVLHDRFSNQPQLTVLDFGSGNGQAISLFAGIVPGRTWITAYDPSLPENYVNDFFGDRLTWKSELNPQTRFDLAIAHYSLHHTGKTPLESVGLLAQYSDRLAIADYDYTDADLEAFQQTFVAIPEIKELVEIFGGDYEKCFEFHREFGKTDYAKALEHHGFQIKTRINGSEVARYKFFLFAEKPPQST